MESHFPSMSVRNNRISRMMRTHKKTGVPITKAAPRQPRPCAAGLGFQAGNGDRGLAETTVLVVIAGILAISVIWPPRLAARLRIPRDGFYIGRNCLRASR